MGVSTVTKRSLNTLTSHRAISIQEACHEIARFDLTICSDTISTARLSRALHAKRGKQCASYNQKDLVDSYRARPSTYKGLSLEQYFYEVFRKHKFWKDPVTGRDKYRILTAQGLNCRPRFPIDYHMWPACFSVVRNGIRARARGA